MGILAALVLAPPAEASRILAILVGATVMALLGLTDDLFPLSPGWKFFFQALAAGLLVLLGVRLEFLPSQPMLGVVLTVLWVMAVTNAMNLIDIMDGLAGGVAVIACLGFLLAPVLGEQSFVPIAAAALAGSALGFLPYNYQPAKIYMGDSGALFIGFTLAGIALGQDYTQVNTVALSAPLFILAVPLYDMVLVMVLRAMKRRSMFRGSNDHLALRLRALGLTVKGTVHLLWGAALLSSVAAWALVRLSEKRALFLVLVLFLGALLFTIFISTVPVDEGSRRVRESPFRLNFGKARRGGKR
jgi:UDP-GlcNAc:undecaprenyl-phosphate GlcNAc-1-phosphate transferase